MKKQFDILVTDSRYKHSLSIVRSLGKSGLKIATCSNGLSPTKFSRYSKKSFSYDENNFEERIISFLKKNDVKLVLPVGYLSNIKCSKIQNEIKKYSNIVIANFNEILKLSNKKNILPILKKNNMNIPKTFTISKLSDAKDITGKSFVVKSAEEENGEKIEYANSKKSLQNILHKRVNLGTQIVQEYIGGEGRGFFAFCENGEILQSFQHRRIRQYPESGGVSSCAESIYDESLENISKKFLKNINWTGPVMLEFIYDKKSNAYYFIEMNAKFWGSYDLSAESGLNFAKIPFDIVCDRNTEVKKYEIGKRFQWILPEDTLRIKTSKDRSKSKMEWRKDFFDPNTKKDIQYIFNDPIPTIIRIFSTIWKYYFKK